MTLSKRLAEYIETVQYNTIPKNVLHFTKLCIVDYYASLLKGKETEPVRMMHDVMRQLGGEPQATAVTGLKTSVTNVAFINGGASHIMELDDIHKASIVHAATVIMPAAIAVAEWKRLSGKELLEAIVVGYEVAFRVGETVTPSHYYYFHNTATCGTFGAAAAVAKLLKLSKEQIVYAFGSAGTQAAGLWEFIEDGTMSKQLHPGKAGMNGILSALLAEQNFSGASAIFEGRRGFFEAMSDQYDQSKMTIDLGNVFKIMENAFKVHASCRHTHAAMDLAVALHERFGVEQLNDVREISIGAYQVALDITDDSDPQSIYAAKFSLQYCVALALLSGKGGYSAFTEEALKDSSIRQLMERIEVYVDPLIDGAYPEKWGARLRIEWQDGRVEEVESEYPKGDPENPLSEQEFIEKFNDLVPLHEEKKQRIVASIMQLDDICVTELIEVLHSSSTEEWAQ